VDAHELAPHIESLFRQLGEPARKLALVRRLKADLLERLRPELDVWPISDAALVVLSLGRQPMPKHALAYLRVAAICVHIEESPEWNALLERSLVGALYRCAIPEVASKPAAKGGRASAKGKKDRAAAWQIAIKPLVERYIAAGKTNSTIGALLASKTGKSAETVRRFAAKVQKKSGK